MKKFSLLVTICLSLAFAASAQRTRPVRHPGPPSIDCTAEGPCPEIAIEGDEPARLPNGLPSPARGFADPGIRRDPLLGILWMAYSWPHLRASDPGPTIAVENHLGRSDDGGESWRFVRKLWSPLPAEDETGRSGILNSETVSLAPAESGSAWYSARISYFVPDGGQPKITSWTIRIAQAGSPADLVTAEESILAGSPTLSFWQPDTNLGALAPGLSKCVFSDPALFHSDGTLYLAAQCMVFDAAGEKPEEELIALFATEPAGSVRSWNWRYAGVLATRQDAIELGGEMLQQTDLAMGRDGRMLAIFTASEPGEHFARHRGCRVVEVDSLEQARLSRHPDGRLDVRARIFVSDQLPHGPGACAYDPASATGVVIVRRQVQPELVVSLHATGIHP